MNYLFIKILNKFNYLCSVKILQLLYYRGIPSIIDELKIPGCETLCPFDKFLDLIRDLIPSDKEMVCNKRQTPDYADTKYPADLENAGYNLLTKFNKNSISMKTKSISMGINNKNNI